MRKELSPHVKPCCMGRQVPAPGFLSCLQQDLSPITDHTPLRKLLGLQVRNKALYRACTWGFLLISSHAH